MAQRYPRKEASEVIQHITALMEALTIPDVLAEPPAHR